MLKRHLQDLEFFRLREGGSFTCGPEGNQEIYAGFYLPVYRGGKGLIVHFPTLERGEKRGAAAV